MKTESLADLSDEQLATWTWFLTTEEMQSAPAIEACAACARHYAALEALLAHADHLGGTYSYADIAFYMAQVFGVRMGALIDDSTPGLLAWRERVGARPAVRQVVAPMMKFLASNDRPVPPHLQALLTSRA